MRKYLSTLVCVSCLVSLVPNLGNLYRYFPSLGNLYDLPPWW